MLARDFDERSHDRGTNTAPLPGYREIGEHQGLHHIAFLSRMRQETGPRVDVVVQALEPCGLAEPATMVALQKTREVIFQGSEIDVHGFWCAVSAHVGFLGCEASILRHKAKGEASREALAR